jgi:MinD-like ATPase involved in chromosome partitioning or flagellar assembly
MLEKYNMYIITFYSFKGGVGRTFAMVNVGVELVKAGRKVLLVDFDLEAPGIHTFNALRPHDSHKGIVEYITDYTATHMAPNACDYIYEPESMKQFEGRMWIMPAGCGGDVYRQRLSSINWQSLYHDHGGYLLFEDLKAQWKESFSPDYVLIDSRTGHTDIEGICTRQLPNAVVILFFPNEQNLAGLKDVVSDIKTEINRSRKKNDPIKMHFVMSNVPDLDDEEGILRNRVKEFRRVLNCDNPIKIHNYPSLALLNQTIFTLDRSNSRLSKEYRRLKDEIVDHNVEDTEGIVRFLKHLISLADKSLPEKSLLREIGDLEEYLQTIAKIHDKKGEVLFYLGIVRKNQAMLDEAISLFDRSIEAEYDIATGLLERATCYASLNKDKEVIYDIKTALNYSGLHSYEIIRLIHLIGKYCADILEEVLKSPSYSQLEPTEKLRTVGAFLNYPSGRKIALNIYHENVIAPNISDKILRNIQSKLLLKLVETKQFNDAVGLFQQKQSLSENLDIVSEFNYAMAKWANEHIVPRENFERVVKLDNNEVDDANYNQCLSVALWAIGRNEEAMQRIHKAEDQIKDCDPDNTEFSCWQYREVSPEIFLTDCAAIKVLITTGEGQPIFFSEESL